MHDLEDSVVYKEFERQRKANPDVFDLTRLWVASGRKPCQSPRNILYRTLRDERPIVSDPGGSADATILAPFVTTTWYIAALDRRIMHALGAVFARGRGENLAPAATKAGDDPRVGVLAGVAVRGREPIELGQD